jgi:hypothetical protein
MQPQTWLSQVNENESNYITILILIISVSLCAIVSLWFKKSHAHRFTMLRNDFLQPFLVVNNL